MDQQLSDIEAMLWGLESNPNLASTMGSLMVLERTPDHDWATAVWQKAVVRVPRLRLRVSEPGLGRGSAHWVMDRNFDLDHHLRFMRLPAKASWEDLSHTAVQWLNDPFDRSRPLWACLVLSGLPGGRAALVSKLHHSIADGLGALQMAGEIYDFGAAGKPPDALDLRQRLAELAAEEAVQSISPAVEQSGAKTAPSGAKTAPSEAKAKQGHEADEQTRPEAGDLPETQSGGRGLFGRVGSVASLLADRQRLTSAGNDAVQAARTVANQFPALGRHSGSPLWAERSRNRRLEWLEVPLMEMKAAARQRGVRLNDVFVAACAEGVLRYHDEYGVTLPEISSTVVVSTRRPDDDATVNAFTPASIALPGHGVGVDERVAYISAEIQLRRDALRSHRDLLGSVSGLAASLPSNLAAGLALDQAKRVDLATSNVPGPPTPAFFGGQEILRWIPIGPVSGTAVNVTLLSYTDACFVGIHLDPAAVTEGKLLKNCIRAGFSDVGARARIR